MIPKVLFKWSFIYQEEIHQPKSDSYNRDKTEEYVLNFVKKASKKWNKNESKVFSYMEKLTGLKWRLKEIPCYVIKISEFGPISDPLTIPIQFKSGDNIYTLGVDRFIDMLVHELIHNLLIQNQDMLPRTYFEYIIDKKYKDFPFNAAIHVPIHAIHKEIFLKYFGRKRLKEEIEACEYYPDYKKAWNQVNKEGSNVILEELRSYVRVNNK